MLAAADRDLDQLVASVQQTAGVKVVTPDARPEGEDLCEGTIDVVLVREPQTDEDEAVCRRLGVEVFEQQVADGLYLLVGGRSAVLADVETYVDALLERLPAELAADDAPWRDVAEGEAPRDAFRSFLGRQRERGVTPRD